MPVFSFLKISYYYKYKQLVQREQKWFFEIHTNHFETTAVFRQFYNWVIFYYKSHVFKYNIEN